VQTFYVHPADFGLAKATPQSLKGGDAATNAAIVRSVLDGATGAPRDVVLLNTGAALFIAGQAATIRAGVSQAAAAIDSQAAAKVLDRLVRVSNGAAT
jgi:anthranilate phosphoribosyltransferase